MPVPRKGATAIGYCEPCQKLLYGDRKLARNIARQHHGAHKIPYRCPHFPDTAMWHIGELPPPVIQGRVTKDRYYGYERTAAA